MIGHYDAGASFLRRGCTTVRGLSIQQPHAEAIMYAAFQQFAPGQDVGIDLSQEYAVAIGQKRK